MVGSPTGVLMQDTTFPTLTSLLKYLQIGYDLKLSPYPNMTLLGGSTIRFRTAEDPEMMRGPNLSGVWLDEASLMHRDALTINLGALREGGEQGWMGCSFTPKGKYHWTYETFVRSKTSDTELFHASTYDNPFNAPNFASTLERNYTPLFARQEIRGEFLDIEGAEFPAEWFGESIWFDEYPPKNELNIRVIAVDSSLGRGNRGDYSAIVSLVRANDGLLYIDADIRRRPSTQIVVDGIEFSKKLHRETGNSVDAFGVESDVFQVLIAREFERVSRDQGIMLPVYEVFTSGVAKEVRIRRLTPYLNSSNFRFKNSPGARLLVQMLQEFPEGDYDDGPDALEMALRVAIDISHESE